jgi:hypothetical protein
MTDVVKFGSKAGRAGAKLDPALKEFLDEVLIPALVQKFLTDRGNPLALIREDVRQSAVKASASAEGVQ